MLNLNKIIFTDGLKKHVFTDVALVCLTCKSDYVHHVATEIFNRDEDSKDGSRIIIESGSGSSFTTHVDNHMSENPSSRRDGIRIHLQCEYCGAISFLNISQHKGRTLLESSIGEIK